MLDQRTAASLSLDAIWELCDELTAVPRGRPAGGSASPAGSRGEPDDTGVSQWMAKQSN